MTAATTVEANAALIKGAYEAFARGDVAQAFAAFAEDILWHVPGRGPLSRDYRVHAEVGEGIGSWCYAPKAPSAVVEVGHRQKFTSGTSGTAVPRFCGSTKATNRPSDQGQSDSSAADHSFDSFGCGPLRRESSGRAAVG
jgi:hypothetical protein